MKRNALQIVLFALQMNGKYGFDTNVSSHIENTHPVGYRICFCIFQSAEVVLVGAIEDIVGKNVDGCHLMSMV